MSNTKEKFMPLYNREIQDSLEKIAICVNQIFILKEREPYYLGENLEVEIEKRKELSREYLEELFKL